MYTYICIIKYYIYTRNIILKAEKKFILTSSNNLNCKVTTKEPCLILST